VLRALVVTIAFVLISTAAAQGRTLTCTSDVQSRLSCVVEQRVVSFAGFEFSVGVDTLAARSSHVAPYVLVAYYSTGWSAWFELAVPNSVPLIGRSNPIRIGFSTTW